MKNIYDFIAVTLIRFWLWLSPTERTGDKLIKIFKDLDKEEKN